MRPRRVSVALLLLVSASLAVQASPAEDLYWEGEEDASNEFLEVKNEEIGISGHLLRIKRDLFDFFSPFTSSSTTTTTPSPLEEIATEDPDADVQDRDEDLERGSGSHDPVDQDLKEKTLRVTFVVMEPYQSEYSNRDSEQFLSFSKAIADAVNLLYENLPGTQKASLVRIQSRISDEFSCKVTLDIVTTGFEDTDRIAQILQDHIRNRRELGSVTVSDQDFKTNVIDPGYTEPQCSVDEIQCSDDTCVSGSSRCNGFSDCPDGSDELGCPNFDAWANQVLDQSVSAPDCERISCVSSSVMICVEQRCNGIPDCPQGDDEDDCNGVTGRSQTTTVEPVPESTTLGPISCPPGAFSCDETRCVDYEKRCDNRPDCYDGTDEKGCEIEIQLLRQDMARMQTDFINRFDDLSAKLLGYDARIIQQLEDKQKEIALHALLSEIQLLRQDMARMQTDFINRFDDLSAKLLGYDARIQQLEDKQKENALLKSQVVQLQKQVHKLNHDSLRSDLEILGLIETPSENPFHLVLTTAKKIGVELDERDVDYVFRAGPRQKVDVNGKDQLPRPLVISFTRRTKREQFLKQAKARRTLDSKDIVGSGPERRIFVNERLTAETRRLFRSTRAWE